MKSNKFYLITNSEYKYKFSQSRILAFYSTLYYHFKNKSILIMGISTTRIYYSKNTPREKKKKDLNVY